MGRPACAGAAFFVDAARTAFRALFNGFMNDFFATDYPFTAFLRALGGPAFGF